MDKIGYNLIRSSLCSIAIVWVGKEKNIKIVRIFLSKNSDDAPKSIIRNFPEAKKRQNKKISFISERIRCYLKGEITHFNLSHLQKGLCSKFQRTVFLIVKQIPYGKVITYKDLAKFIGVRSARTIGSALAKNPFPIIIPCHRVVGFDRKIGGFQCGKTSKRSLLKLEGIKFDKKRRVLKKFFYPLNAIRRTLKHQRKKPTQLNQ